MYLSTGELSKQLQVSIRTLRYYDQIGLVSPSKKAEGGKRLYSHEDILELEKILLLKSLSLSLEDSKKIVTEQSTESILLAHKSSLEERLHHIHKAIEQTNSLLNLIKLEGSIKWEDLQTLIVSQDQERDWNLFFTEDEQEKMLNNLPKLEEDKLSTKKWMNLIKRIELCIEEGVSPNSKQAKLIMEDLDILSEETFQGDQQLINKFWKIRKSEEASSELRLYPLNLAIIEFIEKAAQMEE